MKVYDSLTPLSASTSFSRAFMQSLEKRNFLDLLAEQYSPGRITLPHQKILFSHNVEIPLLGILGALGEDFSNKSFVEVGCGSNGGTAEKRLYGMEAFQPWICRALHKIGVPVLGIDIGDLEREVFPHRRVNLLEQGALDFIPNSSIDVLYENMLFTSPEVERQVNGIERKGNSSRKAQDQLAKVLFPQIERIMKPEGVVFTENVDFLAKQGFYDAFYNLQTV